MNRWNSLWIGSRHWLRASHLLAITYIRRQAFIIRPFGRRACSTLSRGRISGFGFHFQFQPARRHNFTDPIIHGPFVTFFVLHLAFLFVFFFLFFLFSSPLSQRNGSLFPSIQSNQPKPMTFTKGLSGTQLIGPNLPIISILIISPVGS